MKVKSADIEDESYLIITVEEYEDEFVSLMQWKRQKGLYTYLETISQINATYSGVDLPEKMRNCINDYYTNNQTKWVLLGGDVDKVPTKYIAVNDSIQGGVYDGWTICDSYFADLDHNWDYIWDMNQSKWLDIDPEVFIGRLPANSENEMENLVSSIIKYETEPYIGDWMGKGLFAGSMFNYDEDWNNDSIADYQGLDYNVFNHYIADQLLPETMEPYFMGEAEGIQQSDVYYDEALDQARLYEHLEAGSSIGTIQGHADPNVLGRRIFDTDYDDDGLYDRNLSLFDGGNSIDRFSTKYLLNTNDTLSQEHMTRGFYVIDGCEAGEFNYNNSEGQINCLSEWMLKNTAIGCIAGQNVIWSEDEWYEREYGGWYQEGFTFRVFEQLLLNPHPGSALGYAKTDFINDRHNPLLFEINNQVGWEEKLLKQMNLMGDPEVLIWLEKPSLMNYTMIEFNDDYYITVRVGTTPVDGATITFVNDADIIWKGITNEYGYAMIPEQLSSLTSSLFTISRRGNLPVIEPIDSFNNLNIVQNQPPNIEWWSSQTETADKIELGATIQDFSTKNGAHFNVTIEGVVIDQKKPFFNEYEVRHSFAKDNPGNFTFLIEVLDGFENFMSSERYIIIPNEEDIPSNQYIPSYSTLCLIIPLSWIGLSVYVFKKHKVFSIIRS